MAAISDLTARMIPEGAIRHVERAVEACGARGGALEGLGDPRGVNPIFVHSITTIAIVVLSYSWENPKGGRETQGYRLHPTSNSKIDDAELFYPSLSEDELREIAEREVLAKMEEAPTPSLEDLNPDERLIYTICGATSLHEKRAALVTLCTKHRGGLTPGGVRLEDSEILQKVSIEVIKNRSTLLTLMFKEKATTPGFVHIVEGLLPDLIQARVQSMRQHRITIDHIKGIVKKHMFERVPKAIEDFDAEERPAFADRVGLVVSLKLESVHHHILSKYRSGQSPLQIDLGWEKLLEKETS